MVQNRAARLVASTNGSDNIAPVLKELHWLPVKYRIKIQCPAVCVQSDNWSSPCPSILPFSNICRPKERIYSFETQNSDICVAV